MSVATLIGHEKNQQLLTHLLKKDSMPEAFLFYGHESVGKAELAMLFASSLVLGLDHLTQRPITHPDLKVLSLEEDAKLHGIAKVKEFAEDVYLPPYQGEKKVFVIDQAHKMLPSASNALLKTLEEPAPSSVLILLCTSLTEVLPTIASRCCKINFAPLAALEIAKYLETSCECNADTAQVLAIESLGSIQYAQLLASMGQADWRQLILDILKYFHQMSFEDKSTKLEALEKHIEEHGELLIEYVFEFLSKLLRDVIVVRQGWNEHVVFTHLIEDLKVLALIYVESLDFFVACIEEAIKCYKANIKLKSCLEVLLLRINHQGAMRKAFR